MLVGIAMIIQAVLAMREGQVKAPALEYIVAVLGAALVLSAILGFISARLRGR